MATPLVDNPFAVLTLIAAPAVFTNASSVLRLALLSHSEEVGMVRSWLK